MTAVYHDHDCSNVWTFIWPVVAELLPEFNVTSNTGTGGCLGAHDFSILNSQPSPDTAYLPLTAMGKIYLP